MRKVIAPVVIIISILVFAAVIYLAQQGDLSLSVADVTAPGDWPQLQHDAQRTGRTTVTMQPQTRARWIWFGSNHILRNKNTKPGVSTWDDDLSSYQGHDLDMPNSVPFTFSESMQPLIVNGKVFVGDVSAEKVWAIKLDDGATIWEATNPGGALWPGIATSSKVVFTSLRGYVTAWDANSGTQLWRVDTGRTIYSSPALVGDAVIVTSQNGKVYSININTGAINWQTDTGAPITSHPTVYQNRVYIGNEAMYAVALDLNTGQELARQKLMGQSFRGLWAVGVGNRVIFHTVSLPFLGSEYEYDNVISTSSGSFLNEQQIVRNKLNGDWKNWEHIFALKADTLAKDYTIALGPVSGVGYPPDPVTLNASDQPITWWPTYFGTISRCTFGCRDGMEIDISSFDINTGQGVQLPGKSSGPVTGTETDNTFGFTMGGNILFMRQSFRGTKALDFSNLTPFAISSIYRRYDGGGWDAPLNFAQGDGGTKQVPSTPTLDLGDYHVGPSITNNQICFTESFALVCMEHY